MTHLRLSYFDIDGGRAEPSRLALHLGGVAFEDHRIPFAEWPAHRDRMPFGQVPVLEVNGVELTQSNAIHRYVGKLTGLYPEDPFQAACCDEVLDAVDDATTRIGQTLGIEDPATLQAAREALVVGPLTVFLEGIERLLARGGGIFFAGDGLSMADLAAFVWVRWLRSGVLDHVPADLVEQVAPALAAHAERIAALPDVVAYYDGR